MAIDTRYITRDKWTSLVPTQVTYPNGRQVASGYDELYRRNGVTETSGGASIAQWQFFGNRTATVALGNGITCSFMNNAGTNSAVQQPSPANPPWGTNPLSDDRLGYDGSGRMIAKRFLPGGATPALVGFTTAYDPSSNKLFERALHAENRSALYPEYDSMDRLLEYQRGTLASGGGSVATPITLPGTDSERSYNLDGLGNWKTTVYTPEGGSPTTEVRQHNKLNEITKFATTPVLYDHGNNAANPNPLIAQRGNGNISDDGTRVYAYDALNRLTTVTRKSDNAQVAGYAYDALGRRVVKTVTSGGVTGPGSPVANATYRYLYDSQQIVEEGLFPGGSYTTLRQFVWGQYIDELVQLKIPTTTTTPPLTAGTYYPLQDLLYRTTATTNSSGAIVEAYDYDAYGNTLMYSGPGTDGLWFTNDDVTTLQPMCEFLFTGRQIDPETEIYWYRARYYLPKLGRFSSRDRLGYMASVNSYEGFKSRSLSRVDPSGLLDTPIHCDRHQFSVGEIRSHYWRNGTWWHNWGGTWMANGKPPSNDPNSPLRFASPQWGMISPYPLYDRGEGNCPSCTVTVMFEAKGNVLCRADELQPESDWGWERPGLEPLVTEFNQLTEAHELLHVANYKRQFGEPVIAKATGRTCDIAEALADLIALLEMSRRTARFYEGVSAIDSNGDRQRGARILQQIYSALSGS